MSPLVKYGPRTGPYRAFRIALPLLLLLVLISSTFVSVASPFICPGGADGTASEGDSGPVPTMRLYLSGESALSPSPPNRDSDSTASFRPGVGISSVDVGVWRSRPVEDDLEIDGDIEVGIWASGSGLQQSCFFGILFGVDDQYGGDTIHTQETALTGNPQEFSGEGSGTFNLSKGESITILIRVHERGSGGEVVFGSSVHASFISFTAAPLRTSTYAEDHKAGESILVRTGLNDAWGVEDIVSVEQFIVGPYETRQMDLDLDAIPEDKIMARAPSSDQMSTDITSTGMNVSWLWIYDDWRSGDKEVRPGIYYLVGKVHASGGRVYADTGTVVIPEKAPGLFEGPVGAILMALIIGGAAILLYFYALRSERIRTDKGRVVATAIMVTIIVGAGMYVFLTAVPISGPSTAEDAPDFTVNTIDGRSFTLSDHRGKVVLVDLYATWCPSCNDAMPTLVKLKQRYKDAVFLSLSVEGSGDTEDDIKAFKERYGADWPFARDTDRVWQRYQDLSQPYIPTLVIINPQGKMAFREIGEIPFDDLSEQMDKAYKGGFDVAIATQDVSLVLVAFVTGVLSFFAPCAFPLLPGYMGYCLSRRDAGTGTGTGTGTAGKDGRSPRSHMRASVRGGIVAALGIIMIFSMAGVLVAAAGSAVVSYVSYLAPVIAVIIALMGLLMLLDRTAWTDRMMKAMSPLTSKVQTKISKLSGSKGQGPGQGSDTGLFLYGVGYGVASMGCQAPVFVAIIVAGFMAGGFGNALLIFIMFGIGMGIMMVLVTVLVGMARGLAIKKMTSAMPYIKRASGLILLVAGVYLAWYYLSILLGY